MRQHRPAIRLSPEATLQQGGLALSEMFCTMQYLDSGVVSGEFFETEELAHAWYTSLYRNAACMVAAPDGKELAYWGLRRGRDAEMRQWWRFQTGQIDIAEDLNTCCLDRRDVLVRSQQALVVANIYKDHKWLNRTALPLGSGVYHVGIEVNGREFAFGCSGKGDQAEEEMGIFECTPRECENHSYRESVVLGRTRLSPVQIDQLLTSLSKDAKFGGHKGCHFSSTVARKLGVRDLPTWITQRANAGQAIVDVMRDGMVSRSASLDDRPRFGDFTRGIIRRMKKNCEDEESLNTVAV